jgi:hypothetical protein
MALVSLQRALQAHLLDQPSGIAALIVDAPPLPVEERLGIYRHAYGARLREALDDTYPTLHQVLGDELFEALGEAFVAAQPSVHRSIRWYGRELSDFVASHQPYAAQPVLAELTRLEWTLTEAFDAADAEPLARDALLTVAPDAWETLRLQFHPSLRRLSFEWNPVAVWQAVSAGEEPPGPAQADGPVPWLIWRQDLLNYFRSLSAAEAAALDAARRGATFAELCAALNEHVAEDDVPLTAASFLNSWLASGLVVELT